MLELRNGVLRTVQSGTGPEPALALTASLSDVMALFDGQLNPEEAVKRGLLQGDPAPVKACLTLLDAFRPDFATVES